LELRALDGERLAATPVETHQQGVEPLAVVLQGGEIGRVAQQQRLRHAPLDVPVR
jgi:hypothetical protein